ncbi:NUDIX hydrolase [Isoptericola sp. BMS4]|uniref:NUDIX hydrolase n=1 Tax=Isoptericola sp. BMS4 TaxID=2527875 RepID=UPI001F0E1571|nr:NUDIX hydrolase [Isoptericola sp. BMS4]
MTSGTAPAGSSGATTAVHAPAPTPERAPDVVAAGAVVWRRRRGRLQVQLVHRPRYDDWSWPKGKLDAGETTAVAAVREVAEETGHPVVLGVPLPSLEYPVSGGRTKRVHYWAARRAGDEDGGALAARLPTARPSRDEVDDRCWLDVDDAAGRLTRDADRVPLDALLAADRAGRLDTRAVVVARHGRALARGAWHGAEPDRPLTPVGHAQAAAAVPVLAAFGVRTVATSPWARCAATVAPYARAAGLRPADHPVLAESPTARSTGRVAAAREALLTELMADGSAALCTHRPVLPAVLDGLRGRALPSARDGLPTVDPYLEPGELLVAHVAGPAHDARVVATERVTPPLS